MKLADRAERNNSRAATIINKTVETFFP